MLTVELKPFRDAVTKAASVVKPNSPKPILQYLLLTAERNVLSIRASDLEVSVVVKCSCDATEPMKFVLPAAMLRDYLKLATGEQVTIKMDGAIAKLRTDRGGVRNMPTIDADDFPAPDSVSGHAWELPCRALKAAMRVRYAAEDSSRYAMNSVNFQTIAGQRYAVACNGRMLAVQELGETTGEDRRALLPESSSRILANLLPDDGTASVEDDGNRIAVSCEGLDFTSGQMEGRYPEWKKIVPTDLPIRVEIAAASLVAVTREAATAASEDSRGVEYTLHDGELIARSSSSIAGESEARTPIAYSGSRVSLIIDPRFVLECLSLLDRGESVTLEIKDNESAMRIVSGHGFYALLMPILKENK